MGVEAGVIKIDDGTVEAGVIVVGDGTVEVEEELGSGSEMLKVFDNSHGCLKFWR